MLTGWSWTCRNHAFSYWPGFSLNPGLWDLHTVYQRLAGCLDQSELGSQTGKEDEIEGNSTGGSSTDGYNSISIGGGQGGDNSGGVGSSNTHVNTSTSSLVNLFSEDDRLFEQRFSVSCHAAGDGLTDLLASRHALCYCPIDIFAISLLHSI